MKARAVITAAAAAFVVLFGSAASAAPTSVTLVGNLQPLVGCPEWTPSCEAAHMTQSGGIYRMSIAMPAGHWEYKVAINDAWDENYGAHAAPGGGNVVIDLTSPHTVHFYYDPVSHWITDDVTSTIAVAPGSFQSELGCSDDWQPDCFKSWLEDVDGDGTYTFTTDAIPAGRYEMKVALNGTWDVNYGAGGAQNGANVGFSVPFDGAKVTFSWNGTSHVPTVLAGHGHDDNVEWDGLAFDSRSTLYRVPQGAVTAGTPVLLRFRTFHNDVTSVAARVWDVNASAATFLPMTRVSAGATHDYWQATLPTGPQPDVYWYRFVVRDGSSTAYYGDDTTALDGGKGAVTASEVDNSYSLTAYDPSFTVPAWASKAVVYQIFPDRFFNADRKNDPKPTDSLYDLHPTLKAWTDKPEGYCRGYATPCAESPHGTDFFGGDLKGIRQKLEYIRGEGFNTLYLNPIFWAKSNHRYDTADYKTIDPYLGDLKEFKQLVKQAHELGMHIILDGVFNHMSSDSPFFDRYHHSSTLGACESTSSQYRSWFVFDTANVPCGDADYTGWAGFDSIPVLTKSNPSVLDYFLTGSDSVTKHWLREGADGWRLDVMGDPSFPASYWRTFRNVVKQTDPDALIVGELWQKDSTLLRLLDGSGADTTMNYRMRDAVLGLLVPPGQGFDAKGFGDSGHLLKPSEFVSRLEAQREDYAPQVYSALMNLVESHDTARALWQLTPGAATTADKELNAANLATGKRRLALAAIVQYTLPGMPTTYYGTEAGVTGADDPDDRRTYPWGKEDKSLLLTYKLLSELRSARSELVDGPLRVLLADDAAGTVAYGRRSSSRATLVALNPTTAPQTLSIPVRGYLPDGTPLAWAEVSGHVGVATVADGALSVTVPAVSAAVLLTGPVDLTAPAAPAGLAADVTGPGTVALQWNAVGGAASYAVYRSPVTRGGYVKVGTASGTGFTDSSAPNGIRSYYVVRALDAAGNESGDSNEAAALPSLAVNRAVLQWPPTIDEPLTAAGWTVYGQVKVAGITDVGGSPDLIAAQLGWGTAADPATWQWVDATYNAGHTGDDNYEYMATFLPSSPGTYSYGYRFSTSGGETWVNATPIGTAHIAQPADTTAPAPPTGLHVVNVGPTAVELAWDANGEPDLFGYRIERSDGMVATSMTPSFVDTNVQTGTTYRYVVRAVDNSANVSEASSSVEATAQLRTVHVVFTVTVPAATPADRSVWLGGTFAQLGLVDWQANTIALSPIGGNQWRATVDAPESTALQYKVTLGTWDNVEKGPSCEEIDNRTVNVAYGTTGTQDVAATVANWRGLNGCPS